MVSEILDGYSAKLVVAIVVVSAALLLLFAVSRMLRNRGISAHGRTRAGSGPRLAVVDTAVVDTNRRLVLIRRDDVEHLILIGGPSDVVIERRIETKPESPSVAAVSTPRPERRTPVTPLTVAASGNVAAAPETAAPARSPVEEHVAPEIEVRKPATPEPASEPAEAVRTNHAPAEGAAARSTQPPTAPVRDEARRNVEDVLDDARDRVFGSAPVRAADTAQPARPEKPSLPPADRLAPGPRFEDVLDAEIAGDLSAVTPGAAAGRSPSDSRDAAIPERAKPPIDSDMARLLGELSVKR